MKIWVERDGYDYRLTDDKHSDVAIWDEPIEVEDDWWESYLTVQRNYYLMQHFAAVKAGYEDDE